MQNSFENSINLNFGLNQTFTDQNLNKNQNIQKKVNNFNPLINSFEFSSQSDEIDKSSMSLYSNFNNNLNNLSNLSNYSQNLNIGYRNANYVYSQPSLQDNYLTLGRKRY